MSYCHDRSQRGLTLATLFTCLLFTSISAVAVPVAWNSATDDVWSDASKWTPPSVPTSSDDVSIGTVAGTEGTRVTADANSNANTLTMVNGNELDTGGYEVLVDTASASSGTSLSGSGTTLLVKVNSNNPTYDSFDTDSLSVGDGSVVLMLGGVLEVDEGDLTLYAGSALGGYGTIDLDAASGELYNVGTIRAGYAVDGISIPTTDTAATLTINVNGASGGVNLDQGDAIVSINRAGTLDINGPLTDAFSATINMYANSTLDMSDAWTMDNGNLNVNTQAGTFVGQPAGTATIEGATFTQTGGTITLDNTADHLVINAPYTATGGTIDLTEGTITFNSTTTIDSGVDFNHNAASAETELNINATVTINDADWNWDGAGSSVNNVINIGDGGVLNANITGISDRYSAVMNINSGTLNVQGQLDTWGQDGGFFNISGSTASYISGDRFEKTGGTITVVSGAALVMNCEQDWDSGSLNVDGSLLLYGDTEWAGTTVTGTGIIQPGDNIVTADQTITIGTYDWDGAGSDTTTIYPGVTLTINATNVDGGNDRHDGTININSGTLDVNVADDQWELDGVLNMTDTGSGTPALYGDELKVQGNGTIRVDGGANIYTNVILQEGSTAGSGTDITIVGSGGAVFIDYLHTITLDGGDILDTIDRSVATSTVRLQADLFVTGESTVNVEVFDFDYGSTTIEPGGVLTIASDYIETGAVQKYDEALTLNSGKLDMEMTSNTYWIMDGTLNLNNTGSGAAVVTGNMIRIGNDDTADSHGAIYVGGSGQSYISTTVEFYADAVVNISAGASLRLAGTTTFYSDNGTDSAQFVGNGTLLIGGTTTFEETTTIDMPGGAVDLDGGSTDAVGNTVTLNADTTINADTMYSFGKTNAAGTNILQLNGKADLIVNLTDPNDEWTINSQAIVNFNTSGGPLVNNGIYGSDVNVYGNVNVSGLNGYSVWGARADIYGTVNTVAADNAIQFGGGSLADPNRLIGGTITGLGMLRASNGDALVGYGTIDTSINFQNNATLLADNGTLYINGEIVDVGTIGTADSDGVLDSSRPWNTNRADNVVLNGGSFEGGTITNELPAGISGFGTINAPLINNTQVSANGGALILNGSDFDGGTETGTLNAIDGDLELTYPSISYGFDGTLNIGLSHHAYVEDFNLDFNSDSSLNLAGGVYRSNVSQTFAGDLSVNGSISELDAPGIFQSSSNTIINADLKIKQDMTVRAGATFSGTNKLGVLSTSTLTVEDGATIGVEVVNQGTLVLGTSPGQATVAELTQGSVGVIEIEIGGLFPGMEFDQWLVTGTADLDGVLDVSIIGGFSPSLGQTFNIISAGSRVGTFSVENLPTLAGDLGFRVNYLSTTVQLEVINAALEGDLNGDGFVGLDDLDIVLSNWNQTVPPGNPLADPSGDGFVGLDDLDLVLSNWNAGSPPPAGQISIPEPATLIVLGLTGLALIRRG